jgi:hypothetical protein
MSLTEPRLEPADFLRPFLWLAVFAFLLGFTVCLALGYRQISHPRDFAPIPAAAPAAIAASPTHTI